MSFGVRLLLCFWGLLLIALVLPYRYYSGALNEEILQETHADAMSSVNLVSWLIQAHEPFKDMAEFHNWITALGPKLGGRITYIENGRVVADSDVNYSEIPHLDLHDKRPEVVDAVAGKMGMYVRYSTTIQRDLIYAAQRMEASSGVPTGVLRLAIPFSRVKERQERLATGFTWVAVATLMATALLSLLLSRSLVNSIRDFAEAAMEIGKGNFTRRIREIPGKEFTPLAEAINNMALGIEQNMGIVQDQKGQLEAILNGMSEGVLVLDDKGLIESWNTSLALLVNGIERYKGRKPLEAILEPDLQKGVDELYENPNSHDNRSIQVKLEGQRVLDASLEIFMDQNNVQKVILVFHDITELKRLERIRRDFVANVSHELKTPVTSIKGFAETIMATEDLSAEKRNDFLKVILKNADHMARMISRLLTLARIEYRSEEQKLVDINSVEALDAALDILGPVFAEKGLLITNDIAEDFIWVKGDADGLQEVFRNLLGNAAKFSPKGEAIRVFVKHHADDKEKIIFCVEDFGPGIPEVSRERIFERFYRLGETQGLKDGSSGMGLAICRNIIKNSGGRIWVEHRNDENVGSIFCFSMNLAK